MSSTIDVAGSTTSLPLTHRSARSSRFRKGVTIFAVAAAIVSVIAVLGVRYWPFSEHAVKQDLAGASDSTVTIRGYHPTYFPVPGCVLKGVEFRHGRRQFEIITIDQLRIEGSYPGILTRHVPRITAIGARVLIPPFGAGVQFHSQHSNLVVDELVANGTKVEFESADARQRHLVFDAHEAWLRNVRWGSPIQYKLKLHNPTPPGEISVQGNFGPWADGHPQDTPISGTYIFEHAD